MTHPGVITSVAFLESSLDIYVPIHDNSNSNIRSIADILLEKIQQLGVPEPSVFKAIIYSYTNDAWFSIAYATSATSKKHIIVNVQDIPLNSVPATAKQTVDSISLIHETAACEVAPIPF